MSRKSIEEDMKKDRMWVKTPKALPGESFVDFVQRTSNNAPPVPNVQPVIRKLNAGDVALQKALTASLRQKTSGDAGDVTLQKALAASLRRETSRDAGDVALQKALSASLRRETKGAIVRPSNINQSDSMFEAIAYSINKHCFENHNNCHLERKRTVANVRASAALAFDETDVAHYYWNPQHTWDSKRLFETPIVSTENLNRLRALVKQEGGVFYGDNHTLARMCESREMDRDDEMDLADLEGYLLSSPGPLRHRYIGVIVINDWITEVINPAADMFLILHRTRQLRWESVGYEADQADQADQVVQTIVVTDDLPRELASVVGEARRELDRSGDEEKQDDE